jgi:cytoskeletal protein RodZ
MESLSDELRHAREERGIPLAQISDITRISEEYLQAIESGNFKILPQAYVRAFLREYADVVGLSPDDVMRTYDTLTGGTAARYSLSSSPAPAATPPAPAEPQPHSEEKPSLLNATNARIALTLAAVAVLVIVAWNLAGRRSEPTTEEIPFQNVIKQEEQRLAPTQAPPPAASPVATPAQTTPADSLVLRASTTDTVWVMLVRDDQPPLEYMFPPNARISWKARDRFLVTLGKAAAVEFTLNQKAIGTLGKPGAVIRNYEISRKMLARP